MGSGAALYHQFSRTAAIGRFAEPLALGFGVL